MMPFFLLLFWLLEEENLALPEEKNVVQKVELCRFSDRVVVKWRDTAEEKVLYYYNKMAQLGEGDEVSQGSSGLSEIRFEDDTRIRFFSRARFRFEELSREEHRIRVAELTRILILAKEAVTLMLPGGTRLTAETAECYLERDAFFLNIRNAGSSRVQLSGHLVDAKDALIPAGHSVSIPLYDPELQEEPEPIVVREVAGMIVKTTGGYTFEEMPGFLLVSRRGEEDGSASVGGARVLLAPGENMKLRLPHD